ncbi:MAG: hypothetical protein JWN13_3884, partial [Betaproteobacteria bacterium]|nr:hypothetical protein [Betaproteobacteria bacterium]
MSVSRRASRRQVIRLDVLLKNELAPVGTLRRRSRVLHWTVHTPGTGMHHYTFTLVATDVEPGALPAGLTRDELFDKLQGHSKGAAGLVG